MMMREMIRTCALGAVLFAILVLAGCGDGSSAKTGQGAVLPSATATRVQPDTPTARIPTVTHTSVTLPTNTLLPVTPTLTIAPATATATATAIPATATATSTSTSSVSLPVATPTPVLPTASYTTEPTSTATATRAGFSVQSSVEQLLVQGVMPGVELAVRNAAGETQQSARVDDQGTLIFRDLPAGSDYVVYAADESLGIESAPVAVWGMDEVPPNDFYTAQRLEPGFQYITARDGTKLAVNVILPGPPEDGPYPTLVEYSGYDPANPDAPQPSTLIATILGYAAIGVNMRGTGCSGGSFKFFEPAQSTDGYDAIEIIAQQPWVKFNKVGMVGISYPGISQLFTAQLQPPHLASIAPLSVISDTMHGILYPGGILNNGFATDWAAERQREAEPYGQPWAAKRRDQGDQVCIENQRFRGQNPNLIDLIRENNFYQPRIADPLAPANFVDRINVPVFLAGAWQDEQTGGYFPTMLGNFRSTDKAYFTMTNGGHTDAMAPAIFTRWTEFLSFYVRREIPVLPSFAKLALTVIAQQVFDVPRVDVEADRFVNEPSFESALARFEAEPRVRILFENGAGSNRPGAPVARFEHSFDEWPIASTEPVVWYFQEDGRLEREPPTTDGADSYVYDPSLSQRTSLAGADEDIWKALPKWNWREIADGSAVSYETDALADTLVMAGSASVDLWLRSTASDTDLEVTLSEVRPDGQEVYIQSGYLRAIHRAVDPHRSTILRPVHSLQAEDAEPLPPDQFSLARVELFPFAHVFRPNSRVRITIGTPGGNRPRWKFDVLKPEGTVINTIGRSAAFSSRIVLPVLPGIEAPGGLAPCPSLRLQYCRPYKPRINTPAN